MNIKLEECELITSTQYCELINPEFVGQTCMDTNNQYYTVWRCEGKLYKVHSTL